MNASKTQTQVRRLLLLFMIALALSGATAIPVDVQLDIAVKTLDPQLPVASWMQKVLFAYRDVANRYPFLFYGYDWLAFAHFVLAILFIGPYRNPVKNIWVVEFGLIACVLVVPFAFVAGYFRGIPLGWRLIDCSFGVFGFLLLWTIYSRIKKFERLHSSSKKYINELA